MYNDTFIFLEKSDYIHIVSDCQVKFRVAGLVIQIDKRISKQLLFAVVAKLDKNLDVAAFDAMGTQFEDFGSSANGNDFFDGSGTFSGQGAHLNVNDEKQLMRNN